MAKNKNRANSGERSADKLVPGIAFLSLVVSIGSFYYTARTFAVSYRPYLGVSGEKAEYFGSPPNALQWSMQITNVGTIPAVMKVEQFHPYVRIGSEIRDLPTLPTKPSLIIPGEVTSFGGLLADANPGESGGVSVDQLRTMQATFEVELKLSYEAPGVVLGRRRYFLHYRAQFLPASAPPSFRMLESSGN